MEDMAVELDFEGGGRIRTFIDVSDFGNRWKKEKI